MKILHIITSLKIGGAESALYNLLNQFKEKKENKHYIAYFYAGPNVDKIKKLGFKLFKINGLFHKYDPFAYIKLKKIIKSIKPDIIHSALWSANILARILGKSLKIPVICDLHSNFEHDGKLRIRLEKFFTHLPAKYVAVSSSAQNGFQKCIIENIKSTKEKKLLKNNLSIIRNGINIENINQKALYKKIKKSYLSFKEEDFIVGAVGRLEPIKSYDLLIKALALIKRSIPNIKAVIVGDGSEKTKLKELSKELKLKNDVFFAGQQNNPYYLYKIFDCFALSSISEGLSIALLEALSFGLPIITTHNNEKHDVINENENGILVKPKDPSALADAIKKIYIDKDLRKKMRKNNLKLISEKFRIDRVANNYQQLYSKICSKSAYQK